MLFRNIAAGALATARSPGRAARRIPSRSVSSTRCPGTFANVGEQGLHTLQMLIEDINARGGANGQKFELVALDSKANPQEALIAFKQLTDQGVRFSFRAIRRPSPARCPTPPPSTTAAIRTAPFCS